MKSEKLHTEIVMEACKRCFPVEIWIQHSLGTAKYAGSLLPSEGSGDASLIKASVTVPEDEGPDEKMRSRGYNDLKTKGSGLHIHKPKSALISLIFFLNPGSPFMHFVNRRLA